MKKTLRYILIILLLLVISPNLQAKPCNNELTITLAGDAIITQPWSDNTDPNFLKLIEKIKTADVAIANLEVVIHTFKGYAQAHSGGIHLSAPPQIANQLKWAGFDMLTAANNHTFDYGSIGTLEIIEHTKNAGLITAGAGKDLQSARMPKYFKTPKGTIALISATTSFQSYGIASRSRPDIKGRPGPNPLAIYKKDNTWQAKSSDKKANLDSIRNARKNSDTVIMSIHWHHHDINYLRSFAHESIDAGADIVFCHGPHKVMPIEIYKNKPIFYSLGDFVFQNEQVEKFPVELYDHFGLDDDAKPIDLIKKRYKNHTTGFPTQPDIWQGTLAQLTLENKKITKIELIPLDLRFGKPAPPRGTPIYANPKLGKKIITDIKNLSEKFNTEIKYIEQTNSGILSLTTN